MFSKNKKFLIIIPNWNSKEITNSCYNKLKYEFDEINFDSRCNNHYSFDKKYISNGKSFFNF